MLADEITTGVYRKMIQKFPETIVFSNAANTTGKRVVILLKNFKYFMPLETVQIWLVMYCPLIDGLIDALNYNMSEEEAVFSLNGATNIFNYPEFNDIIKAKSFLNMIEKKETIDSMLKSKGIQKDNVNIIIGSDNDLELAKDCSIVTATVSYTHLRAHETVLDLVCRLLLEKKKKTPKIKKYTLKH